MVQCTPSFAWLSWVQVGSVHHKAGCLLSRDMLTRYKNSSKLVKMFPRWWSWSPACSKGGTASTCPPATSPPASSCSAPFLWSPLIQTVLSSPLLLLLYPYHLPAHVLFSINIIWNILQLPPTATCSNFRIVFYQPQVQPSLCQVLSKLPNQTKWKFVHYLSKLSL